MHVCYVVACGWGSDEKEDKLITYGIRRNTYTHVYQLYTISKKLSQFILELNSEYVVMTEKNGYKYITSQDIKNIYIYV